VIGLLEPEICPKMLKKMCEKLRAKFPATTPSCFVVKIGRLNDSFLDVFLNPKQARSKANRCSKKKKAKEKMEVRKA